MQTIRLFPSLSKTYPAGWSVLALGVLLSLLICLLTRPSFGQVNRPKVTSAEVKEAIRDGVSYLKRQQQSDGTWMMWRENERHGVTALATFALLNAGVDPRDPVIQKAARVLKSIDIDSTATYSLSFQTMVLCLENPKANLAAIQENVQWFEDRQWKDSGNREGGWGYNWNGDDVTRPDNSISQVALLALHEAQTAGAVVKPETWARAKRYWERQQNLKGRGLGGFGYESPNAGEFRGSMTAAGISSLIIATENAVSLDDVLNGGRIECCGKLEGDNYRVEQAIGWMARNFSASRHPIQRSGNLTGSNNELYYLYSLERAGRLAGRRFFGPHDWYRAGAEHLVAARSGKDYWSFFHDGRKRDIEVVQNTIGTSFALLFLAKGLRPIVIGKYQHSDGDDWDLHRKGVHFLTRETEKAWDRKLNWLDLDGRRASVNDLLEAPVLFISGRDSFELTEEQRENLAEYVNQGGFIFAEACQGDGCDPGEFDKQFRQTMEEIFSGSFEPLDAGHPVWTANEKIYPNSERPLLGLQACCRTSIIYCPSNLSCFWQLNQPRFQRELQGENLDAVDYCTQLGINVITYATNRELRDRLNRPKIESAITGDVSPDQIEVGKVLHGGGADDAAVALQNLMQTARREASVPVSRKKTLVSLTDPKIFQYPILFMHGRSAFELSDSERQALRKMVKEDGFFLFADSICASEKFAESFRKEMQLVFPDAELKRIGADHELFTKSYGSDISSVTLRTPLSDTTSTEQKYRETQTLPYLEGIEIDGSFAIIFSPYDLSCALENAKSVECKGYPTNDATRIGINVLRYALNREVPD